MNLWLYVYMFFLHFLADFVLQSREMGEKKSSSVNWLFAHVAIQWITFFVGLNFVINPVMAYQIASINALIHGIIDWNIWKLYKAIVYRRLQRMFPDEERFEYESVHYEYWKDKGFYTTIGLDQALHYSTIVLVIWWML